MLEEYLLKYHQEDLILILEANDETEHYSIYVK